MLRTTEQSSSVVLSAVRALSLACRFDQAQQLLDLLQEPTDPVAKVEHLLARAEAAHRSSYVHRTPAAHSTVVDLIARAALVLADLEATAEATALGWDVRRLGLQHRYTMALR